MRRKRKRHTSPAAAPPIVSPPPLLPNANEQLRDEERAHDEEARKRGEEVNAQIAKERAEREAKKAALDEQIRLAQTELMLLEKSLLDAQHSFERSQIELSFYASGVDRHVAEVAVDRARAAVDLLHDTRLLIMARKAEHDRLVDERSKFGISNWGPWAFGGLGLAAILGAVYWLYLDKNLDKKK